LQAGGQRAGPAPDPTPGGTTAERRQYAYPDPEKFFAVSDFCPAARITTMTPTTATTLAELSPPRLAAHRGRRVTGWG